MPCGKIQLILTIAKLAYEYKEPDTWLVSCILDKNTSGPDGSINTVWLRLPTSRPLLALFHKNLMYWIIKVIVQLTKMNK